MSTAVSSLNALALSLDDEQVYSAIRLSISALSLSYPPISMVGFAAINLDSLIMLQEANKQ
jgi:hypothetical protein